MPRDLQATSDPTQSFGTRFLGSCKDHRERIAIRTVSEDFTDERICRAVVNCALR